MTHLYRGKMIHGNKKYNFEPLNEIGGHIEAKTSNIYALKSSLRTFFKQPIKKMFEYEEVEPDVYKVTRIA